ncbi:nucleotidyl transferase AbiEii/AbiGii toxin family protein [Terracidiphilus sp.]|uniref:nucleotidyl transferase AbiEii/AbiGii toxin family protein n=1 Tax=Terracidiphilus sp. TaxID=1964191 RepID=UPI003C148232
MRNESRKSGSGRGGEKPVAVKRYGAPRLLLHVTVFRDDLGQGATIEELEAMTGKKRRAKLDAIRDSCRKYINDDLQNNIGKVLFETLGTAGTPNDAARLESDPDDADQQTLLLWYPSVTGARDDGYVRPAVRIESGAKSALDPNGARTIAPYITDELGDVDFSVANVTTVEADRTLWDKVVILHGLRSWFEIRGEVRQEGQRITRHYYDVHRLVESPLRDHALETLELAIDCSRHARMFFNRPDYDLQSAVPGQFALTPTHGMLDALRRDYDKMAEMIFGPVSNFNTVIHSIESFEALVNQAPAP